MLLLALILELFVRMLDLLFIYAGRPPSIQGLQGRHNILVRTWKLPFLSGNIYHLLQTLTMYIVPAESPPPPARQLGMEHGLQGQVASVTNQPPYCTLHRDQHGHYHH